MGYKSRGISPNHINANKCKRKYNGARANGPPSPITNNMRVVIDQYHEKVCFSQMLGILNSCFDPNLNKNQLIKYCQLHKITFPRKAGNVILDLPNFKSSGDALDDYLANLEDPLDAADLLPESVKRAYDALYGDDPDAPPSK